LSRAPMTPITAGIPSLPCRFSTITGLPHRAARRSAHQRAAMSVVEPAGSGTMMRTARCGHGSAVEGRGGHGKDDQKSSRNGIEGMHDKPHCLLDTSESEPRLRRPAPGRA